MNIHYKILIMMFLAGAGAGVSLLVLGREIACQAALNTNMYVSIAAAYAGGAGIAMLAKARLKKAGAPVLNMAISFSAIAGVFSMLAAIIFVRFYKVALGLQPEQALPHAAAIILPVLSYLPGAVFSFTGLAAAKELASRERTGGQDFTGLAAAGGAISGMLIHALFLWRYYTNIDVLYALGILVLAATYVLFRDKSLEGRWTMLAVITSFIIYLGFNIGGFKEKADRLSSTAVYKAYYVVAEKEFPTVKFVMAKKGGDLYVFENGSLVYMMPDAKYAEMAKLAQGRNVIIINGGAAGLVEELEKSRKGLSITAYEADPYTSYILENLFRSGAGAGSKAVFKAGDITKDADLKKSGFQADTVFINAGRAGSAPYSKKNLEAIKGIMAPGGRLVISAAAGDEAKATEAANQAFGAAASEKGFIKAAKSK